MFGQLVHKHFYAFFGQVSQILVEHCNKSEAFSPVDPIKTALGIFSVISVGPWKARATSRSPWTSHIFPASPSEEVDESSILEVDTVLRAQLDPGCCFRGSQFRLNVPSVFLNQESWAFIMGRQPTIWYLGLRKGDLSWFIHQFLAIWNRGKYVAVHPVRWVELVHVISMALLRTSEALRTLLWVATHHFC